VWICRCEILCSVDFPWKTDEGVEACGYGVWLKPFVDLGAREEAGVWGDEGDQKGGEVVGAGVETTAALFWLVGSAG
jgi:hypothetical protein